MSPEQLAVYRQCTGRSTPPPAPVSETWLICGRRAGKSFVLALVAVYLAAFHNYRSYLAPGERATVLIIATNTKQARVIFRYVRALLTRIPMLAKMIERETADAFDLNNDVSLEIHVASYRSIRGYAVCAALLDELAFWPSDDAADPDFAILDAVRPSMATIPNAMLLCASSPYARRGALHDAYRKHFGIDGDKVLVWKAATRTMNPTVPQSVIDEATERDPSFAAAEYGGEFRTDIENFILREAAEACVSTGVRELAPQHNISYCGFCDPSGGSADSMTLAIGHKNFSKQTVVVDALREIHPPFSPEVVVGEFSRLLKSYRVTRIWGDRYAGAWPVEQFSKFDVRYDQSAKPKSDLYTDLLPLVNSRRIELLDSPRLLSQLIGLERRTARGGHDSIDHAPGGHDDLVNAVAGLAAVVHSRFGGYSLYGRAFSTDDADDLDTDKKAADERYRLGLAMHIWNTCGHWPT
jgi:hypothetical protein